MNGLYVLDGSNIITGAKTAIAAPTDRDIAGKCVLVIKTDGGGSVVGTVVIGRPKPVDIKMFDLMIKEHGITSKDRMRWWPGKRTLYVYQIERYDALPAPMKIDIPPGVGMKMAISLSTAVILDRQKQSDEHIHTVLIQQG